MTYGYSIYGFKHIKRLRVTEKMLNSGLYKKLLLFFEITSILVFLDTDV